MTPPQGCLLLRLLRCGFGGHLLPSMDPYFYSSLFTFSPFHLCCHLCALRWGTSAAHTTSGTRFIGILPCCPLGSAGGRSGSPCMCNASWAISTHHKPLNTQREKPGGRCTGMQCGLITFFTCLLCCVCVPGLLLAGMLLIKPSHFVCFS